MFNGKFKMTSQRPTILVTGASGFLGGHVVKQALERGYNVRVTARTEESARRIVAAHSDHTSQLSYAVVPDLTKTESYEKALDGSVMGVLHLASPFIFDPADNVRDLLDPAIRGSTAILEAIGRWGHTVTRVVATSSFAAIIDDREGSRPGYTYTDADWNPATYERAATSTDGAYVYRASKVLAEKAMFAWVEENNNNKSSSSDASADGKFTLTTICPPWIYGPYAQDPVSPSERLSESVRLFTALLVDKPEIPPFDFGGYADVREVATAHLLALEAPKEVITGRRFIVGQQFRYQTAVDLARDALPELRDRLPIGRPGHIEPGYAIDGSKAAEDLGLKYMTLRETITNMLSQLLRSGHIKTLT